MRDRPCRRQHYMGGLWTTEIQFCSEHCRPQFHCLCPPCNILKTLKRKPTCKHFSLESKLMDSEMEGKGPISPSKMNHEAVSIMMENQMVKCGYFHKWQKWHSCITNTQHVIVADLQREATLLTLWYRARPPVKETGSSARQLPSFYRDLEARNGETQPVSKTTQQGTLSSETEKHREQRRKKTRAKEEKDKRYCLSGQVVERLSQGETFWKILVKLQCCRNYLVTRHGNASLRENVFKILAEEPIWKLEWSRWLQPLGDPCHLRCLQAHRLSYINTLWQLLSVE